MHFVSLLVLAARRGAGELGVVCPQPQHRRCSCLLGGCCLVGKPESCVNVSSFYDCVDGITFQPPPAYQALVKSDAIKCNVEKVTAFCNVQLQKQGCPGYDATTRSTMEATCRKSVEAIKDCDADCTGAAYTLGQFPMKDVQSVPKSKNVQTNAVAQQAAAATVVPPNTVVQHAVSPTFAPPNMVDGTNALVQQTLAPGTVPQGVSISRVGNQASSDSAPDSGAPGSGFFNIGAWGFVANVGMVALVVAAVAGIFICVENAEEGSDSEEEASEYDSEDSELSDTQKSDAQYSLVPEVHSANKVSPRMGA